MSEKPPRRKKKTKWSAPIPINFHDRGSPNHPTLWPCALDGVNGRKAQGGGIQCSVCQNWWHRSCANVRPGPHAGLWKCMHCVGLALNQTRETDFPQLPSPISRPHGVSPIPSGTDQHHPNSQETSPQINPRSEARRRSSIALMPLSPDVPSRAGGQPPPAPEFAPPATPTQQLKFHSISPRMMTTPKQVKSLQFLLMRPHQWTYPLLPPLTLMPLLTLPQPPSAKQMQDLRSIMEIGGTVLVHADRFWGTCQDARKEMGMRCQAPV
jgi:hypothetical protein